MLVNDVIEKAAILLGEKQIAVCLKNNTGWTDEIRERVETLLQCFNMVENEVALDYLPLTAEDTFTDAQKELPYTAFRHFPVSVLGVYDEYGNKLPFTAFPEFVRTRGGNLAIAYSYSPRSKGLNEESDFKTTVSARLLAYGVASEYCLIEGLYEEGVSWDKKYKDALLSAMSVARPHIVRSRRWV